MSDEAYDRLETFASKTGTDMTAFLEALAMHLDPDKIPAWLKPVIADARRIKAERGRRAKR